MAFNDLKFLGFLRHKMGWHQARQQLLAQNVANADTPSYRVKDLKEMSFNDRLRFHQMAGIDQVRTDEAHMAGPRIAGGSRFGSGNHNGWEVTPEGNAVVLEEEMMKVAANQFDYQLASSLYSRSLGILRTAIGRNG